MRGLDFSSWQALLSTLVGLAVITLIGVGIRLLVISYPHSPYSWYERPKDS